MLNKDVSKQIPCHNSTVKINIPNKTSRTLPQDVSNIQIKSIWRRLLFHSTSTHRRFNSSPITRHVPIWKALLHQIKTQLVRSEPFIWCLISYELLAVICINLQVRCQAVPRNDTTNVKLNYSLVYRRNDLTWRPCGDRWRRATWINSIKIRWLCLWGRRIQLSAQFRLIPPILCGGIC